VINNGLGLARVAFGLDPKRKSRRIDREKKEERRCGRGQCGTGERGRKKK
jgi:hypothetical protein